MWGSFVWKSSAMDMINLAPGHKMGLMVGNPILLAAGVIGAGDAVQRGIRPECLGGVVVGPISRYSQSGVPPPRLAEVNSGFVLGSGLQNRGIGAAMKRVSPLWARLGCPVVVQIADTRPGAAGQVAERLMDAQGVMGLELAVNHQAAEGDVADLVRAVVRSSDLPLWVKLPLSAAVQLAPVAVAEGASGLVIGQPLWGAGFSSAPGQAGKLVRGMLYGPLGFGAMLAAQAAVMDLALPAALIACGGVHTIGQVRQALATGARAVQIDSAAWIEPGLAARLVQELEEIV
jgi:dihydroorotate dehydrogenase (NAD+) catalytic subunit